MSTLTLNVPDDLAAAVSVLPPEGRAALDDALRSVVFAVAKTNAPLSVSWEELTGFTDAEEEDFAANLGRYVPTLAASSLPAVFENAEEATAWERLN